MKYQNVTNPPLLTSAASTKVIEVLSIPELHLLIGKQKSFIFEEGGGFNNNKLPRI